MEKNFFLKSLFTTLIAVFSFLMALPLNAENIKQNKTPYSALVWDFINKDYEHYSEPKVPKKQDAEIGRKEPLYENKSEDCYDPIKFTKRTKDNTYREEEDIVLGDPHYGWQLGQFCLSGYTDIEEQDNNKHIYYKTLRDKVKFSFKLWQIIDRLDGKNLRICEDINGSDGEFQTKPHNMKRGELVIKKNGRIYVETEYSDYLAALTSPKSDTTVIFFEEGDYEVHLNYTICKPYSRTNYREKIKFQIKNGNVMVYIFDIGSMRELGNEAATKSGFRIDKAKSKYTKLIITKKILNSRKTGLVEDVRFNRFAKDGEIFDDEGIYTIRAIGEDKKIETTEKTIYVVKDENGPLAKWINRKR